MQRQMYSYLPSQHLCPVTGTKLYCLVTETRVCEQLVQCRYLAVEWPGVEPMTLHHIGHMWMDSWILQCNNWY